MIMVATIWTVLEKGERRPNSAYIKATHRIEYTLRMNCILIGKVASATEPPNYMLSAYRKGDEAMRR